LYPAYAHIILGWKCVAVTNTQALSHPILYNILRLYLLLC